MYLKCPLEVIVNVPDGLLLTKETLVEHLQQLHPGKESEFKPFLDGRYTLVQITADLSKAVVKGFKAFSIGFMPFHDWHGDPDLARLKEGFSRRHPDLGAQYLRTGF
jgi:hypothetical protein